MRSPPAITIQNTHKDRVEIGGSNGSPHPRFLQYRINRYHARPRPPHHRLAGAPARSLVRGLQFRFAHLQPSVATPREVSCIISSAYSTNPETRARARESSSSYLTKRYYLQVPLRPDHSPEHGARRGDAVPDVATTVGRSRARARAGVDDARGQARVAADGGVHGQRVLARGAGGDPVPRVGRAGPRVWGAGVPAAAGVFGVCDMWAGGILAGESLNDSWWWWWWR